MFSRIQVFVCMQDSEILYQLCPITNETYGETFNTYFRIHRSFGTCYPHIFPNICIFGSYFIIWNFNNRSYSTQFNFGKFLVALFNFWNSLFDSWNIGHWKATHKKQKTLFTALTSALTPKIIFTLFLSTVLATTYPIFSNPPERMSLTNVSVKTTNPLTLSLNSKSFYMTEIYFDEAYVKDYNQITVASIIGKEVMVQKPNTSPYWTFQFVARLPATSEKILTLNFNTTLPSGEYSIWLHSYRQQTFTTLYFNLP